MENIRKLHELLKDNPELQQKIAGEANRLVEAKEVDGQDALIRVVKANLGIDLTREELDTVFAKVRELDPEQLEQASGGLEIAGRKIDPSVVLGVGTGTGTVVGTAVGTAVCPGVGTFVGGIIGTAVGYIGSNIFNLFDD